MQSLKVNDQNFASVNWEDEYYKYCEFVDISTDGGHVTSDFANCTFKNIDWYWGIFNIVNFVDCIFVNCVFRGTSFSDCNFVKCELQDCRFIKDSLDGGCTFGGAVAYNCEVSNSEGFEPDFPQTVASIGSPENKIIRQNVVGFWHDIVRTRDASELDLLLADEVVFYSPVVHAPQVGKAVTAMYLTAALHVFGNESFRYVREVVGENDAMLEFETEIDGVIANGVDMIKWNDEGKIVEFKVMIRTLKAINLIHQKMAARL